MNANEEVENFNKTHEVGDILLLRLDSGKKIEAKIKHPASIVSQQAVGWFEGVSGCYRLDRIEKISDGNP